jgi:hypothetical protein
MTIKYEYESTCCKHFYIETRRIEDAQVVTKCNVCGQGEYQEINQVELEDVIEPVYVASEEVTDMITEPEA